MTLDSGLHCRYRGQEVLLDPRGRFSIGSGPRYDVMLAVPGDGELWATIRMTAGWCVQPDDGTEVALRDGPWLSRPVWIQGDESMAVRLRRNGSEAQFEVQQASSVQDPQQEQTIPRPRRTAALPLVPPPAPASQPSPPPPEPPHASAGAGARDWIIIGREGGTADLRLAGPDVALRHARIRRRPDGSWDIRDLSRGLGVFVDGRPVLANRIPPGGWFIIGHYRLQANAWGIAVETVRRSPVLECHDVEVTYRDRTDPSLTEIDFVLNTDEFLTVLGPSSAGKSTLFRALLGEVANVSGSIGFAGEALPASGLPGSLVSFLPQEDHLPMDLTVRQTIRLAARLRLAADLSANELIQRTNDAMARLDLMPHANTDIAALSGGTRKRVSLALELLSDPILLILDEPTSGLDEGLDRRLMRLLASLARSSTAILLVTHSMANLDESDHVLAINGRGTTGYFGPPQEMLPAFGAQAYADVMDDLREGKSAGGAHPVARSHASGRGSRPSPAPARRNPIPVLASRELRRFIPWARGSKRRGRMFAKPAQHLLMAPLVVGLLACFVDPQGLAMTARIPNTQLTVVLSVLSITAAFFAAAVTSGSVVSDYAMISREARWGIQARSVVISRFLVLGTIALLQGAVASLVFFALRPGPSDDGMVPGPLLMTVSLSLLCLASAAAGLFVSALARTVQQGIFALMMLSVTQVVLSGLITPLGDPKNAGVWVLNALSWVTPIRWAVAALGAGIGLNSVPGITPDTLWSHDVPHVVGAWVILGVLTMAFLGAALTVLSARLRKRL
jgi:ABC transport system ATP-binding/permease protein